MDVELKFCEKAN